jgi:hypothetical protein
MLLNLLRGHARNLLGARQESACRIVGAVYANEFQIPASGERPHPGPWGVWRIPALCYERRIRVSS